MPPVYSKTVSETLDPKTIDTVERAMDQLSPELRDISLKMHGSWYTFK